MHDPKFWSKINKQTITHKENIILEPNVVTKLPPYKTSLPLCGFTLGAIIGFLCAEFFAIVLSLNLSVDSSGNLATFPLWLLFLSWISVFFGSGLGVGLGTLLGFIFRLFWFVPSRPIGAIIGVLFVLLVPQVVRQLIPEFKQFYEIFMIGAYPGDELTQVLVILFQILYFLGGAVCGWKLTECKSELASMKTDAI